MHRTLIALAGAAFIASAAFAMAGGPSGGAAATIRDANGKVLGSAKAMDHDGQLMILVDGKDMPAGTRAVHIHTTGKCEGPKFESAGPHWNTMGRQHGRENPAGAHEGDLPNLAVKADGSAKLSYMVPSATLAGLMDADGSAIVVHEKADDYKTDPTGNAGGRIACGVFARK